MYDPEMKIPQPTALQSWYQLGVMVIDGSGSMTLPYAGDEEASLGGGAVRSKAEATEEALKTFVHRMIHSHNAANFGLSFVFFNSAVTHERKPTLVKDLDETASYNPTAYGTGGTAIYSGLDAAVAMVESFMRDGAALEIPLSAVVVLMSDGEEQHDPAKVKAAAERIKSLPKTDLTSCLFATKGQPAVGEPLLQEIASGPDFYQRAYSTEQLRKFFEDSLFTVAGELEPAQE
jgi:hypothetical protein